MPSRILRFAAALVALAGAIVATPSHALPAYGLSTSNQLVVFDTATPGTTSTLAITGLVGGDTLLAIDFRPATGQLYALGSGSRLYTVDTTTGGATQVGSDGAFTLGGTAFGFDVNPVADRIRVTSDTGQNLRLNPTTGTLAATDTSLAYAAGDPNFGASPTIAGSAYTSSFPGATSTTLYAIDTGLGILANQNPPNSGTLNTVGPLGVAATTVLGFDISTVGGVNTAYASMVVGGTAGLYTINLTTGAATLVGAIGSGATGIGGLALQPASRLVFRLPSFPTIEGTGSVHFIFVDVLRVGSTAGVVGATVTTGVGTATAGVDYTASATSITFGDGDATMKSVPITVMNDLVAEPHESIPVSLTSLVGLTNAGPDSVVWIIDDDAPLDVAYGVDAANNLVTFDLATPGVIFSSKAITGLAVGETIVGIDFRPADAQLYGVGSTSRLYTIDTATGAATQVGSDGAFTLSGTSFGTDFNPVPDRLRIVSDADQNMRINPNNGTIAGVDVSLAYAAGDPNAGANPNVVGSAYTNSFPGAVTTTLYGIDSNLAALIVQNPPNNGTLNTVGALGVAPTGGLGFDIRTVGSTNTAYATMVVGGVAGLYTVDLTSGAATLVGALGDGVVLRSLAVPAIGIAPAITSANTTTFTIGASGTFTVTATGSPTPVLSLTGVLPSGVTFNPATGVLAGPPGAGTAGTYNVVITATNGVAPVATQNFALIVAPASFAPAITSANATTFTTGAAGTFTVTATGSPTPTLSLTGALPSGVTFTPATGALAGTPAAGTAGTYNVTIGAANGVLPNATQAFTLTVVAAPAPPVFTSGATASFTAGLAGTFTVTATGTPAPTFVLTGTLPAGLVFNGATGVLSGTPLAGTQGTYPVSILASNGVAPDATLALTIIVAALPSGSAAAIPASSPLTLALMVLLIAATATMLRRRRA